MAAGAHFPPSSGGDSYRIRAGKRWEKDKKGGPVTGPPNMEALQKVRAPGTEEGSAPPKAVMAGVGKDVHRCSNPDEQKKIQSQLLESIATGQVAIADLSPEKQTIVLRAALGLTDH